MNGLKINKVKDLLRLFSIMSRFRDCLLWFGGVTLVVNGITYVIYKYNVKDIKVFEDKLDVESDPVYMDSIIKNTATTIFDIRDTNKYFISKRYRFPLVHNNVMMSKIKYNGKVINVKDLKHIHGESYVLSYCDKENNFLNTVRRITLVKQKDRNALAFNTKTDKIIGVGNTVKGLKQNIKLDNNYRDSLWVIGTGVFGIGLLLDKI